MLKRGPIPQLEASNFNIFELINFQTYQWLPHSQTWLPFSFLCFNHNRPLSYIAWHSRYPTVHPHSYQYRLLRSMTDNNLEQVTKVLKKTQKLYPQLINSPIDKQYFYTPLQYACVTNNYAALQLLLLYGANINLPDKEGNTPLMLAVQNQSLQSINSLLKSGCDWRMKNKYGITAQQRAKQMRRQFISDFINDYQQKLMGEQNKKSGKKSIEKQNLVIKRRFPRFRVKLDIQKQTQSPFWNFLNSYNYYQPKVIKNPFNNFSGDYRLSFNSFEA